MKKIIAAAVLAVAFLAGQAPQIASAEARTTARADDFDYRIRKNEAFLKAARQIITESGKKELEGYLAMADALSREAYTHYYDGHRVLAYEDMSDSTRLAILAITLSKVDDESIRDIVIAEELAMQEMRDRARTEAIIERRFSEVKVFIQTAERLLYKDLDNEIPRALERLNGAKAAFEAAERAMNEADPDSALAGLDRALAFATSSVKEIKRSRDEVITFPPPPSDDAESLFDHELKKNDTYVFFADQVIHPGDQASGILEEGRKKRDSALKLKDSGEIEDATAMLKDSTEALVTAIKMMVSP
jgi:hypothetical protein